MRWRSQSESSFLPGEIRLLPPEHPSAKLLKGSRGSRGHGLPLLWDPAPVCISNPSFLEVGFFTSSVSVLNAGSQSRCAGC